VDYKTLVFRWFCFAVLLAAITVSGLHRRRARARSGTIPRSREDASLIAGRLLVALPLFGGSIAYVINPGWMAWSAFDAPNWLRWMGVGLGVCVVPAVHWVLTALGSNVSETVLTKDRHELVSSVGPYRWIRHPLYTTGIALFLALGLMSASWFILALALVALVAIRTVVVPREERELVARFGSKYQEYRRVTGALLPRVRSG
jgi:protein-S-isoprenylcysteine O-methyltransferase Ste14